jgi:hypothetical protein
MRFVKIAFAVVAVALSSEAAEVAASNSLIASIERKARSGSNRGGARIRGGDFGPCQCSSGTGMWCFYNFPNHAVASCCCPGYYCSYGACFLGQNQ